MSKRGLSVKRVEVLTVIDRLGILTRKQIQGYMDISDVSILKGIRRLEELGFVATYKLARGYAHYITKSGSDYLGNINFGYVKRGNKEPNLASLEHNLLVNDCILQEKRYLKENIEGDIRLISEREQLAELNLTLDLQNRMPGQKQSRSRNRVPDFLLRFSSRGEKVTNAYEVELTRKNKNALLSKLSWYQKEKESGVYDNIVYLYEDNSVKSHVETNAAQVGLKVFFRKIE